MIRPLSPPRQNGVQRRGWTFPAAALVVSLLPGCAEAEKEFVTVPVGLSLAAVELVSYANTQKTVEDHVVSWVTGEDCSERNVARGDEYCRPEHPIRPPPPTQAVFCYRSLAKIDCYTGPAYGYSPGMTGMDMVSAESVPPYHPLPPP